MAISSSTAATRRPGRLRDLLPAGVDLPVLAMLLVGALLLYVPTWLELSRTLWATDEQGQGPIILIASLYLLFTKRDKLAALADVPASAGSIALLMGGLLVYAIGRSQTIWLFEVGSQPLVLGGLLWMFKGRAALRLCWFPLFFLIFMIPLPGQMVAALTAPLKSAVSYVASGAMYQLGYPVARSGVVLMVGQYQLLVADACAGLTSMFTLEALGLLYLNFAGHAAAWRNVLLALLVIPVAFVANVIRVIVLVLVTYHFGDAAGQGFVHGFAGIVLFVAALLLIIGVDGTISLVQRLARGGRR